MAKYRYINGTSTGENVTCTHACLDIESESKWFTVSQTLTVPRTIPHPLAGPVAFRMADGDINGERLYTEVLVLQ